MRRIIALLVIVFLVLSQIQIGTIYAMQEEEGKEELNKQKEKTIQALGKTESLVEKIVGKLEKKIKNKKKEERLKKKEKEIKTYLKQKKKEIKKQKNKTQVIESLKETKRTITLKIISGVTKYENIEDGIGKDIAKTEKKKLEVVKSIQDSLQEKNGNYTLIIKTRYSLKELQDKLLKYDEDIRLRFMYSGSITAPQPSYTPPQPSPYRGSRTEENYFEMIMPENSVFRREMLGEIEDGEIPDKFLGIQVVQPEVFEIQNSLIPPSPERGGTGGGVGKKIENLDKTWGIEMFLGSTGKDVSQKHLKYLETLRQKTIKNKKKIKIGIVDTGVDYMHPDLKGNIGNGYDFIGKDKHAQDDQGHGTHVAGIIGAKLNGLGIIGVNPFVEIIPLKICDKRGFCPNYAILKSLKYAKENKIDIINMSLGGRGETRNNPICQGIKSLVKDGIIVVSASGNASINASKFIPGGCEETITVGAYDKNLERAYFSNYGEKVDVSAPGVDIYSTYTRFTKLNHFYKGYKKQSGTSMSAPHISGLVSVIKTFRPEMEIEEVMELLKKYPEEIKENSIPFYGKKNEERVIGNGVDVGKIIEELMEVPSSNPYPGEEPHPLAPSPGQERGNGLVEPILLFPPKGSVGGGVSEKIESEEKVGREAGEEDDIIDISEINENLNFIANQYKLDDEEERIDNENVFTSTGVEINSLGAMQMSLVEQGDINTASVNIQEIGSTDNNDSSDSTGSGVIEISSDDVEIIEVQEDIGIENNIIRTSNYSSTPDLLYFDEDGNYIANRDLSEFEDDGIWDEDTGSGVEVQDNENTNNENDEQQFINIEINTISSKSVKLPRLIDKEKYIISLDGGIFGEVKLNFSEGFDPIREYKPLWRYNAQAFCFGCYGRTHANSVFIYPTINAGDGTIYVKDKISGEIEYQINVKSELAIYEYTINVGDRIEEKSIIGYDVERQSRVYSCHYNTHTRCYSDDGYNLWEGNSGSNRVIWRKQGYIKGLREGRVKILYAHEDTDTELWFVLYIDVIVPREPQEINIETEVGKEIIIPGIYRDKRNYELETSKNGMIKTKLRNYYLRLRTMSSGEVKIKVKSPNGGNYITKIINLKVNPVAPAIYECNIPETISCESFWYGEGWDGRRNRENYSYKVSSPGIVKLKVKRYRNISGERYEKLHITGVNKGEVEVYIYKIGDLRDIIRVNVGDEVTPINFSQTPIIIDQGEEEIIDILSGGGEYERINDYDRDITYFKLKKDENGVENRIRFIGINPGKTIARVKDRYNQVGSMYVRVKDVKLRLGSYKMNLKVGGELGITRIIESYGGIARVKKSNNRVLVDVLIASDGNKWLRIKGVEEGSSIVEVEDFEGNKRNVLVWVEKGEEEKQEEIKEKEEKKEDIEIDEFIENIFKDSVGGIKFKIIGKVDEVGVEYKESGKIKKKVLGLQDDGEYIIAFSTETCGGCNDFKPYFKRNGKTYYHKERLIAKYHRGLQLASESGVEISSVSFARNIKWIWKLLFAQTRERIVDIKKDKAEYLKKINEIGEELGIKNLGELSGGALTKLKSQIENDEYLDKEAKKILKKELEEIKEEYKEYLKNPEQFIFKKLLALGKLAKLVVKIVKNKKKNKKDKTKDKCDKDHKSNTFKKTIRGEKCTIFKMNPYTTKIVDLGKLKTIKMTDIKKYNKKIYEKIRSRAIKVSYGLYNTKKTWIRSKEYISILNSNKNKNNTNLPKGNFGELSVELHFIERGFNVLDVYRVRDINQKIKKGIDHVFEKDGKYYIVESKFGTAKLGVTAKGIKQMSDDWIEARISEAVNGNKIVADSVRLGLYTSILANIDRTGKIKYTLLDGNGNKK